MTTQYSSKNVYIPRQEQPPALYVLFFAELWERFSFYGLRSLLVLFMTKHMLLSDSRAYEIYGAYGALVYTSPVVGGYVADHFLGNRLAIYIGGVMIALGHFILAIPMHQALFPGLAFIAAGTGLFKANISSLLGHFYETNDSRRDGGFTLFYMGINIGAFLAPLVCGFLGEQYGWHYGFATAGVGMLVGLVILLRWNHVLGEIGKPPDWRKLISPFLFGLSRLHLIFGGIILMVPLCTLLLSSTVLMRYFLQVFVAGTLLLLLSIAAGVPAEERKCIATFAVMLPFYIVFFACFEQAGGSMNLFASRNLDRTLFGWEILPSSFQMLNPLFVILLSPLISALWLKLSQKKMEPLVPFKFSLGLLQVGIGFAWLVMGINSASNGLMSMSWLAIAYLFHSTGELCLSPIGLSMTTKLSPARFSSFMMGTLFLSIASAHYIAQVIAKACGTQDDTGQDRLASLLAFKQTFQVLVWIPISAALLAMILSPIVNKVFQRHQ